MGIYAITGASSGIGAKTKELLIQQGHKVINIDLKDGDICVNLASQEGRQSAVDQLHTMCPDGLDGMICNAGVSGACGNLGLIISLNYFGTVAVANGVYDLLKKKHGSCVVTVSNTISQGAGRKDIVDLLNNIGDEKRILSLISSMDSTNLSVGNSLYVSTKYALARWVRRVSATWAANGVRINAVAPGNVHTAMTATMSTTAKMALNALPIPTSTVRSVSWLQRKLLRLWYSLLQIQQEASMEISCSLMVEQTHY
jgi:NAD(P)-dependent dehydrogenase (short-subunit alcohol dehydrogenase family)